MHSLRRALVKYSLLTAVSVFAVQLLLLTAFLYFAIYRYECRHIQDKAALLGNLFNDYRANKSAVYDKMAHTAILSDGEILIFQPNGQLLFSTNPDSDLLKNKNIAGFIRSVYLSGTGYYYGNFLTQMQDMRLIYACTIKNSQPQVVMLLALDRQRSFGFARNTALALLVLALCSTLVLYFLLRRFTANVNYGFKVVKNGATAMSDGDYSTRIGPQDWLEFQELGDKFNHLAETVQNNITALEEQHHVIKAAHEREAAFSANISHELRTPLTGILLNSEAISNYTQSIEECRELSGLISKDTRRLKKICENLLLLSKFESGTYEQLLDWQQLNPVAVVNTIITAKRLQWADKNQLLEVISGQELFLESDEALLRQILENLIDNACKYSPDGARISVFVTACGDDNIKISVRDSGPGIAAGDLPKIFDRFFRAEKSRARKIGGAGLGLSITRQITGLLGGSISVVSAPGQGSEFTVVFPVNRIIKPEGIVRA